MKEEGCREGEAVVEEVLVVLHERREVRGRVLLLVMVLVVVRHVVPAEANRERRRASMTGRRSSNPEPKAKRCWRLGGEMGSQSGQQKV